MWVAVICNRKAVVKAYDHNIRVRALCEMLGFSLRSAEHSVRTYVRRAEI